MTYSKLLTTLLMTTGALFFSLTTFTFSAFAEDSTSKSNAEIEFKEGTGVSTIVDPEKPDKELDQDDKDNPQDEPTGDTGALTLDFVSSVAFGEHEVSGSEQVYESETLRPFIQVTDRRGTKEGWNVSAKASNFTSGDDSTLQGSTLSFLNGSVTTPGSTEAPSPNDDVSLATGGDSTNVVNADKGEGMGKWITHWIDSDSSSEDLNSKVTLTVPGGVATTGEHKATITWTLADAPQ